MGSNLSTLISHSLGNDDLYSLPEILARNSKGIYQKNWEWYDCKSSPSAFTSDTCLQLCEDGHFWIIGPNNLTIIPSKQSMEVCYGWDYSHFFADSFDVREYIDFCSLLAKNLDCRKIYFVSDLQCQELDYLQLNKEIQDGKLTEADVTTRLQEYMDHDVYSKTILK